MTNQEQLKNNKKVLFLISPNFGLLDSWLPALTELKKRKPGAHITAVFPKYETVREINPIEAGAKLGEKIFTSIIFKSRAGSWVSVKTFAEAKACVESNKLLSDVVRKIRTLFGIRGKFKGDTNVKAICFDIFSKTKKEAREILEQFPNVPRFSILHGIAIADFPISGGSYDKDTRTYPAKVYAYSKHEIEAYRANYGLSESEVVVTGIPRHEKGWIEELTSGIRSDIPTSWERYIFLISRPSVENFFPREKKSEVLKEIKKLAEKVNAKIVVRVHPTEVSNSDGLFEEVFGKNEKDKSWMYSSTHPFMIGQKSLFAISFYSGVCIDMLAIGVPTIERTVVESNSENKRNGFIMDYKAKGLVRSAKNYEELEKEAKQIIENKNEVINGMKSAYEEYFAPKGNPAKTITDDILKVIE